MNILICCAGGMSSSMLVQKMRDEVKKRGLVDIKVGACAMNQLNQYASMTDVLLIAPQISFITHELDEKHIENLSIFNITNEEYGTLDASHLLDRVLTGKNETPHPIKTNSLFESMNQSLAPIASKVSTNKYLEAVSKSFTSIMPITMIGSVFMLLANLPLKGYTSFLARTGLSTIFNLVTGSTLDFISIYLVFFIAYNFVRSHNEHGHPAALIALINFFLITGKTNGSYSLEYLGTKGIFAAIFIGLISGFLYIKILKISPVKLPKKIPTKVARQIYALYPSLIIISFFTLIAGIVTQTNYGNLHTFFYQTIQSTLTVYLGNNIFSYVLFQLCCNTLWFFGIHGGNIITTITNPVYIPLALENFNAYSNGLEPTNIISNSFAKCFTSGGVGSMFSLSILMTCFSKSKQYKTLGKIALPTTFFYINEPLLFGIPIIMNPLYFFPLMLITPILGSLTYFVMHIGLVPIPRGIQIPWTTPPFIYGLFQGGIQLAMWELICILLAMLIWYPFFKIGDNEAFQKEHNECHN